MTENAATRREGQACGVDVLHDHIANALCLQHLGCQHAY